MAAGHGRAIMDDVWKSFPPELYENVLRSVPLPELCRLRAVSTAWSHLMERLKFAEMALYIIRTATIVNLRRGKRNARIMRQLKRTWKIYDPSARKSFPRDMRFLYDAVKARIGPLDYCKTLAAHWGFVAVVWLCATTKYDEPVRVANPVTGSFVDLPPLYHNTRRVLRLRGADGGRRGSLLYVVQEWDVKPPPQSRRALRFDSRVREWQEFSQPPATLGPSDIVQLGSTLFALFWDMADEAPDRPQPWSLDAAHDVWTDTAVALPAGVVVPRLAIPLGRLFFVGFGENGIQLLEVDVAAAKCTVVVSMKREDNDIVDEVSWLTDRMGAEVVAKGLEDHIVLSSVTAGCSGVRSGELEVVCVGRGRRELRSTCSGAGRMR